MPSSKPFPRAGIRAEQPQPPSLSLDSGSHGAGQERGWEMTSHSKIAAFCPNVLAWSQAGNTLLMERKRTEASQRGLGKGLRGKKGRGKQEGERERRVGK